MNRLQAHELEKLIKKVSEMEEKLNALVEIVYSGSNGGKETKKRGRPPKVSYAETDR